MVNQILLGPARYRNMYTPLPGSDQTGTFVEFQESPLHQRMLFE